MVIAQWISTCVTDSLIPPGVGPGPRPQPASASKASTTRSAGSARPKMPSSARPGARRARAPNDRDLLDIEDDVTDTGNELGWVANVVDPLDVVHIATRRQRARKQVTERLGIADREETPRPTTGAHERSLGAVEHGAAPIVATLEADAHLPDRAALGDLHNSTEDPGTVAPGVHMAGLHAVHDHTLGYGQRQSRDRRSLTASGACGSRTGPRRKSRPAGTVIAVVNADGVGIGGH